MDDEVASKEVPAIAGLYVFADILPDEHAREFLELQTNSENS